MNDAEIIEQNVVGYWIFTWCWGIIPQITYKLQRLKRIFKMERSGRWQHKTSDQSYQPLLPKYCIMHHPQTQWLTNDSNFIFLIHISVSWLAFDWSRLGLASWFCWSWLGSFNYLQSKTGSSALGLAEAILITSVFSSSWTQQPGPDIFFP